MEAWPGSNWDMNAEAFVDEEPEVKGPDGTDYYTVEQAARSLRVRVSRLRRWEREQKLKPTRKARLKVYTPECMDTVRTLIAESDAWLQP